MDKGSIILYLGYHERRYNIKLKLTYDILNIE